MLKGDFMPEIKKTAVCVQKVLTATVAAIVGTENAGNKITEAGEAITDLSDTRIEKKRKRRARKQK